MFFEKIQTRFAPAPSGTIHLGNIRAALLNLIFAKKLSGRFLLRIEDTDKEKVSSQNILNLLQDLSWLGINYDEGPNKPGKYTPYLQSERTEVYKDFLDQVIKKNYAYKCFCSKEKLEAVRQKQILAKLPPRYDRTCLKLSSGEISHLMKQEHPFVWRFLINPEWSIKITDFIRGPLNFDMKNFSDFVISRSDGSFNFLFANFVDDITMDITHVIRGEDHLSNGALQACLYKVFEKECPIFLHLPLILDHEGQKLSKRSNNFDLNYLKETGILPETICCYLASLGSNITDEALNISEIIEQYDLNSISSQSVQYDIKKILQLNKKWINRLSNQEILNRLKSLYYEDVFLNHELTEKIIQICKTEAETLSFLMNSIKDLLKPSVTEENLELTKQLDLEKILRCLQNSEALSLTSSKDFDPILKIEDVTKKEFFSFLRLACTGKIQGLTINEIISILPQEEILNRCYRLIEKLRI